MTTPTPTREQVIERSRIDFECYFLESRKSKGANRAPTFQRYEHDGTYIDDHTQRHWWTWQQAVNAGRDQGLREAGYPADFEPVEFLVGVEMWVKAAYQKGGDRLWKITRGFGEVLNKQGQWEREPTASNRTDEFLARCRYATLDECAAAIEQLRGE